MIRFFSQKRKQVLEEGVMRKYLKYATGEIFLVVIGILIALQINNWNENRKQNNTLTSIYLIIKEDLQNDVSSFNSLIKDYEDKRKPAFEAIQSKNQSRELFEENPSFIKPLLGFEDITINKRGLDMLKNIPIHSNNIKLSLSSDINKFYNDHLVEVKSAEVEMSGQFFIITNYFNDYDWFSSFVVENIVNHFDKQLVNDDESVSDFINLIVDNPKIKNHIVWYSLLYQIYIEVISEYVNDAEMLIQKIDNHVQENT